MSQSTVPTKRQGISKWYKPCTNRNCRGVWHSHSDHQSGVPSHIHRTPSWNSSWNPSWNPSSLYPVQVGKVALEVHVRNNKWLLCKPMNAGFEQKGFQMGSTHKGFYHSIEERTGGNIHGMNPAGYHRVLPIVTGNQSNDISIWHFKCWISTKGISNGFHPQGVLSEGRFLRRRPLKRHVCFHS